MAVGRFLVVDGEIPRTSKRCFSCMHYSSEKSVTGIEKFCSGQVVKIGIPDKAFCDEKRKDVNFNDRCAYWKIDKRIKSFIKMG